MKSDIDVWINELNTFQIGIFLILFGIVFTIYFKFLHKTWKKEGYRLFKPFRREGKTQSEDNFVIIMYTRTLLGIYGGYLIILFGFFKILSHFKIIDF
ncbi:hypothetical protein [Chryseobacterium lacus]|uniref:hypothetical protein n=1 Tax=Chryseobacterium lacus TaxID=2058346 RepID=UPI000F88C45A|nr:hypothetical protein [Chryseobacterium lacus]RST26138.1 hypothetical protein EIZ46_07485 [Chryseobacterium lacus]